jgi:uncharacterized protein (DUF305 family)
MKSRWIGITGAVLVLTSLVLGAVGPRLFPTAFGIASTMPSGTMMNGQMMGGMMHGNMPNGQMNGMMNGTMPNGQMNGQMMGGMMHGNMPNGQMNGMMNGTTPNGQMNGMMMGGMMSGQVGGDASLPFDQRFLDQMIMHHEGAVMSTQMMIAGSERPELRDLAQRIITGQQREIEQMREWRTAWYGSAGAPPTHEAMMAQMGAGGMMNGGSMGQMMGGNADADHMYLQMMIPHHQAAISMAQQALSQSEHPEIKTLAEGIIATQQAEIEEMQGYLAEWYGGK